MICLPEAICSVFVHARHYVQTICIIMPHQHEAYSCKHGKCAAYMQVSGPTSSAKMHKSWSASKVQITPRKEGMVSWQESLSPLHKELLQAPGVTAQAASLIISMLEYNPETRITAAKVC